MILVTFALPFESAAFRASRVPAGVEILHTGTGPARASAAIVERLKTKAPDVVVISGFAGGLVPKFHPGHVIVGENVSSPELMARCSSLARRGAAIVPLHSADHIVTTAAYKAALRGRTGAAAVDMESATLWAICESRGVATLTLRVISDGADRDLCLPTAILNASADRPVTGALQLLSFLARHPWKIPEFVRFVGDCRLAQRELAAALQNLIADLRP